MPSKSPEEALEEQPKEKKPDSLNDLLPFDQIQTSLQQGTTTCKAIVDQCLHNIAQGAHLNAFLRVYAEEAKQQAVAIDQKRQAAHFPKLGGMIVGLKDLLCYKNHPIQAASKILEGFVSQFSATAVHRLVDKHAIIIENCDQFGMGSSNENSAFGPVHNPLDITKVPGGSSGGSAVAVQAHMCHVSLEEGVL